VKTIAHKTSAFQWRFWSILLLLSVLMAALLWHVINIQILPGEDRGFEFLQSQGMARTLRTEIIPAYRGIITDRNGETLAVSTPVVSIWANPEKLLAAKQHWPKLLQALSMDGNELQDKLLEYKNKQFMYLQRQLPPVKAQAVLDLGIEGVYGKQEYQRFYPAGEVTAHLVGFTNIDDNGQEGIELSYDQWLAGTNGKKQVLKDLRGRVIKDLGLLQSASSGKDVVLSIDLRLQYLAYRELKAAVRACGAKSGSLVLLDAHTGEVLAMVNQPSYNPNDRGRLSPDALRNRAITDQFEPGSTMKPLTIMAALESGRFLPTTQIDTNPGYIQVNGKTLLDPVNYGVIDVTKIITKSSQVGLTKVSLDLEGDNIRDMFFRLGMGQSVGTGFPGEGSGVLPSYNRWQPIVQANFSFGYGVTLTALQLVQAYGVIANQGIKRPLSILKQQQLPAAERVVAKEIALQAIAMLKTVTQPGGTATRAHLQSYQVAGKTGTIHKVGANGYADDRYLSLFVGFAPADEARVIAVVVIDEPTNGKYFGGEVAAPVFAHVVDNALRLLQVPPSNGERQLSKIVKSIKAAERAMPISIIKEPTT
jgi:cell division protein FtsI (penicillin-binding protein 3)